MAVKKKPSIGVIRLKKKMSFLKGKLTDVKIVLKYEVKSKVSTITGNPFRLLDNGLEIGLPDLLYSGERTPKMQVLEYTAPGSHEFKITCGVMSLNFNGDKVSTHGSARILENGETVVYKCFVPSNGVEQTITWYANVGR